MKEASVLGAGELGKACALALAAGGASAVRLLTRDVSLVTLDSGSRGPSAATPASPSNEAASSQWPSSIGFYSVSQTLSDDVALSQYTKGPLFVCTPITAYLSYDNTWAKTALGSEHSAVTYDVLRRWRRTVSNPPLSSPAFPAVRPNALAPFVSTLTRGFTADGFVPAQIAEELLNRGTSASPIDDTDVSGRDDRDIPVLVAAGPLMAMEWARQCTPITSSPDQAASSSSKTSFIPPRPRSVMDGNAEAEEQSEELRPVRGGTNATALASSYPHAFSGASLTFAAWTPSIHADAGRQDALAQQLHEMFSRESITYLREPDAAAVLSIVNGCAPLCAFGAGLVSSVYSGANVNALASYAQHATSATEQLINQLLGRSRGTPLPIAAWSTLNCACTSLVSREFALGRQLNFYFRKQDAEQAIFRGRTHQLFAATVDGLHTRMQASGVASPFYEVLMDTYNTMIRASRAGEGLVKEGYYGYRDAQEDESVLLRHAMQVDEAMLSGDEGRFAAAKERLVKAFSGAVAQ
ncbi:hypothetical protein ABL78_4146 [Leptomonas seymouri]|uniref:Uncharacterized protein n=1 Tax=Leptomonas seymouri TaxID=5684 RepID=A0A0N0P658_LEPSE|nr:hypothetical protein ABL78_4146 [Leptomonas seymouri]|eukprot:KPI86777.1 hypothetical protein ABL78_4146 [Leptomonas seymouri]